MGSAGGKGCRCEVIATPGGDSTKMHPVKQLQLMMPPVREAAQ